MAFFVKDYLKSQIRKCFSLSLFFVQRLWFSRMNNRLAYVLLATIAFVLITSTLRCSSGSYNQQDLGNFMSAVREKEDQVNGKMTTDNDPSCSNIMSKFSADKLATSFENCAKSSHARQVDMDCYLDGWDELIRFLNMMGRVFSFVSSDVIDKVRILREFRDSEEGEHYKTVESMIKYEKENNLINYKQIPSGKVKAYGSRTVLRLHRALKFLLILLGKLARNEDGGKVSTMGYNAYYASPMSKYHPWAVRKGVEIAVYVLPNRSSFMKQLCQDIDDEELAKRMLVCSESMDAIFEYTHVLYSKNDILEIP